MERATGDSDMLKEKCMSDLSCKEAISVSGVKGDDMHSPCLFKLQTSSLYIHNGASCLASQDLIK